VSLRTSNTLSWEAFESSRTEAFASLSAAAHRAVQRPRVPAYTKS
jgi:hypothetical protein